MSSTPMMRGLLLVLSALLCWPLAAADVEPESDVDLKLVSRRPVVSNSIGMKLVHIPAGRFLMGAPEGEAGASSGEKPQHEVEITKDFYLGATEVTQKQWQDVMGSNPSCFSRKGHDKDRIKHVADRDLDQFPVDSVTLQDVDQFMQKLAARPEEKKAGRSYRLPTEAEWEYACRAGTTTAYHFGDKITHEQVNFYRSRFLPWKVASYPPNAWGLYDMHGNVAEWVSDWHQWDYYKFSPRKDPQGPDRGEYRSGRGGSWRDDAKTHRSAARRTYWRDGQNSDQGFRVVMVPSR